MEQPNIESNSPPDRGCKRSLDEGIDREEPPKRRQNGKGPEMSSMKGIIG